MRPAAPRVVAISPPTGGPWVDELALLAQAGVEALVLRLLAAPADLAPILARPLPPGLALLVRPVAPGDADRALERGLGLHLPAADDPAPWCARVTGLLSAACHDAAALRRAGAAGCDLALVSPVYPPGSKPGDPRPALGLDGLRRLCAGATLPVLGLGGVDADRARAIVAAGAWGVAGIGAFFVDGHVAAARAAAIVAGASAPPRAG